MAARKGGRALLPRRPPAPHPTWLPEGSLPLHLPSTASGSRPWSGAPTGASLGAGVCLGRWEQRLPGGGAHSVPAEPLTTVGGEVLPKRECTRDKRRHHIGHSMSPLSLPAVCSRAGLPHWPTRSEVAPAQLHRARSPQRWDQGLGLVWARLGGPTMLPPWRRGCPQPPKAPDPGRTPLLPDRPLSPHPRNQLPRPSPIPRGTKSLSLDSVL